MSNTIKYITELPFGRNSCSGRYFDSPRVLKVRETTLDGQPAYQILEPEHLRNSYLLVDSFIEVSGPSRDLDLGEYEQLLKSQSGDSKKISLWQLQAAGKPQVSRHSEI